MSHLDSETGIGALRQRLKKLDCAFLLGAELYWRLDDCDWEAKVWRPIYEWVERGYMMLFGDSDKDGWPRPIDSRVLEAWEHEEQELEYRLFARMDIFIPKNDSPVLDAHDPFTIRWRDCPCYLGDTDSFKVMKRLIDAKGRMVSRVNVGLAIGNHDLTDEALRQAASRLKKKLVRAGLDELAERIKTTEKGKFIYLDRSGPSRLGTA